MIEEIKNKKVFTKSSRSWPFSPQENPPLQENPSFALSVVKIPSVDNKMKAYEIQSK